MRIYQLGDGTPEVAVVAAIHGDEPCGVRAIERLVAEEPDASRPVKLVVANEEALARDVRYLDEDLNRAFPGAPDADTLEGRLAHELDRELRDCTTLSLHSTQSYGEPFALVDTVDAVTRSLCPHLPIDVVVETDRFTDGRLIQHPHTVEAECGFQGSEEAADNAYWLVRAFLAATGALAAPLSDDPIEANNRDEVAVFRLLEEIPKAPAAEYEVFATNFERIDAGERFAAAGGEVLAADEAFYPVLMSPYGYRRVFGYAAEKVGVLS
ncbi:succinylglutamate desuccinylase/aspartoacylase domain-containing protein [Halegenticoccus tardaugens]|uniref:succinylglutamate desuccinylase/aspartoacylase domain-containing protein n=1 Tax=Halegenticoccus tardaugens TaxID=2071624 RepID=UPI00100B6736|nr:succinylglutamate desuccinylase/aspartoacylase family protein [Halegenticoccus tardaugens]